MTINRLSSFKNPFVLASKNARGLVKKYEDFAVVLLLNIILCAVVCHEAAKSDKSVSLTLKNIDASCENAI